MSQYVFILGAGASKECGAPLMADFLERAAVLSRRIGGEFDGKFRVVSKAISALQQVHSKSALDLYNLESVFSVFEMGRMLGRLPGFESPNEIEKLLQALRSVIAWTLEESIEFQLAGSNLAAPPQYEYLAKFIRAINERASERACSVITFNYDTLAEIALAGDLGYDYRLEPESPSSGVPLLKLHGSLNWGRCAKCDKVVPLDIVRYLQTPKPRPLAATFPVSRLHASRGVQHCHQAIETPHLVPPTWNKTDYAKSLQHVWREAARHLSEAETIIVCGYSLPETDIFFKHMFALGTFGDVLIQRFWVFDPDPGGTAEKRFRDLLGPAAVSRFQIQRRPFSEVVSYLGAMLKIKW